ncbi:TylF/MycF/NovP-related O-methyltransferase [Marinobacterium stanieri]|uniref:TylF/MycF/NovP-related O-methyltransferase n=1 Tax=Marinobacterium stanieri TaxID=49186 RepID=UPI000255A931|nr:TylF/MycF/NovP-related O-methyltransferase [Marinobacterium stanieri]
MNYDPSVFTSSDIGQLQARDELFELYQSYQAPQNELERSLPLFMRASLLARVLAVQEVFLAGMKTPGCIMDFGTWRGMIPVLCENLRAVYEPMNTQRRIYAFDTFEGYSGFTQEEVQVDNISDGKYSVEENYEVLLGKLLNIHERNNVLGSINGKHKVIRGLADEKIDEVLSQNPGLTLSHVFFDLNCYEPTEKVMRSILPRLNNGGVIALWQFGREEIQAESRVYLELIAEKIKGTLKMCKTYPSLVYFVKES